MDDSEVGEFRAGIKLLQRRLRREARPVYGVSRTASQVLAATVRCADPPGPRQLARDLQMTSSNVAAALRELEDAAYIVRRRDPADARRVSVCATERGRTVVSDVLRERDTWLGRAVQALLSEEEQRTLLAAGALMQRLAAFEPGAEHPPVAAARTGHEDARAPAAPAGGAS
ncbi:MarR family winged helix-turn-helix transcriptional regulator [Streptomyces sp. NPDC047002]|uniref:MarR family winged helix-turn-helix transcriptional regulator n=1 Tax=Streptomyces sp. NPDC047002 TaxID=3155475 RepID=UPI003454365D